MTRARDIAGGTIFTGADHTKLDGIATGATAYVHPTGAGNQHVPASGAAGQLLQYASAGTAAWATVSTGADDVVFPNLASPNNTYTSSGTWSKGSLSNDDYVWFYFVGGGGGGGRNEYTGGTVFARGGSGGDAILIYGKAKFFDGAAYVIGAGNAGQTANGTNSTPVTNSTLTLTSTNGSSVYSTSDTALYVYLDAPLITQSTTGITAVNNPSNLFTVPSPISGWTGAVSGSENVWEGGAGGYSNQGKNGIFGGGGGGGRHNSFAQMPAGGSLYAGAGGAMAATGVAGTYPGGGGGGSITTNQQGASGGNGNLRVYHV